VSALQAYLRTHVAWRIATVVISALFAAAFWSIDRTIAYAWLVLAIGEALSFPYFWRRARKLRKASP
jgi:hypothetical protein